MGKVDEGMGVDVEGVSLGVIFFNQSFDLIELGVIKDGVGRRFLYWMIEVEMLVVFVEMVFGGLVDFLKGMEYVEC